MHAICCQLRQYGLACDQAPVWGIRRKDGKRVKVENRVERKLGRGAN